MSLGIYKKGQGYWTRLMSAIAYGMLVLMGAVWLWTLLQTAQVGDLEPVYVQAGAVVLMLAVFGLLGYYLIGRKPKGVDFMVATEGEMKKVNWSTRREIMGQTWVVIGMTILIAILCAIYDFAFAQLFRAVGVLET